MRPKDINLLKQIATEENISVDYFDGGKCYTIPYAALFVDTRCDPLAEDSESMNIYINCLYKMQMGIPFIRYDIISEASNTTLESAYIPLESKRRNKYQRNVMSLINLCAKRVIAQELASQKFALHTALSSASADKQYS